MTLSNQEIYNLAQNLNDFYANSKINFPATIAYIILENLEIIVALANKIAIDINELDNVEAKQKYLEQEQELNIKVCPIEILQNVTLSLQDMATLKFMFISSYKIGDNNVSN